MSGDDVGVTLHDGALLLKGEKRHSTEREENGCFCTERFYGSFQRTIPLPADSDRFFVIEEFNAPPVEVYSDNFEGGQGDWTIGSDGEDGTAWELGSPTVVGPPSLGRSS